MSMPTSTATSQKPDSGFSYAAAASGKQKNTATTTATMASVPVDSPADVASTVEASNGATTAQCEASLGNPTPATESIANTSSPNGITGKEDKEGCIQEEKQNGWDKQSQNSSGQAPEATKPKEFIPAPAPAVNVWKVRQEAQAAKTKAAPTIPSANPATVVPETTATITKPVKENENNKKKGPRSAGSSNWDQNKANGNDKNHTREQRDRKKVESTKEKIPNGLAREDGEGKTRAGKSSKSQAHASTNLPLLTDANSWPTPENAKEDNKEKKPRDESREKPASGPKSDKTSWTRMEIDSTAAYSGVSPKATRGGRTGRGGNRGGFDSKGANGQKYSADGSLNATDNDRGRASHGDKPSRGGHFGGRGGKRAPSAGNAPSKKSNQPHLHGSENRKEETTLTQTNTNATIESVASSDAKPNDAISPAQSSPKTNVEKPERQQAFGVSPVLPVNASGNPNFEANPLRERNANGGRGGYRGGRGNSHYNGTANGGQQAGSNTASPQNFSGNHQPRGNYQFTRGQQRVVNASFPRYPLPTTYPLHTYPANYEMNGAVSLSNGYMAPVQAFDLSYIEGKLREQVEYYFSVDNLCKDMWLRKKMDSEGFTKLTVVADFQKIKNVNPPYEQLKDAILTSSKLEVATSPTGEGVRPKEKWRLFVLEPHQRHASVPEIPGPWTILPHRPPRDPQQSAAPQQTVASSQMNNQYVNGFQIEQNNGHATSSYNNWYQNPSQYSSTIQNGLSAEVPSFTPSKLSKQPSQADAYPDSALDQLVIVCSKVFGPANGSFNGDATALTYYQIPASETDSTIALNNGAKELCENLGWIDPKADEGVKVPIPSGSFHFGYKKFKEDVLQEKKEKSDTPKMAILYKFWSHFLLCHFNRNTYRELRQFAMDDNRDGLKPGFEYYIGYLKAAHKAPQQPPLIVTHDLIDLSKYENTARELVKLLYNDPTVAPATRSQIERLNLDTKTKALQSQ